MYIFNTLTLDREYDLADQKRLVPINLYESPSGYKFPDGTWGGRATHIAETDTDILMIMEYTSEGYKILGLATETLENKPLKVIKELARKRKLNIEGKKKEEIIAML